MGPLVVLLDAIREQPDRDRPEDEPADVGEVGDPAGAARRLRAEVVGAEEQLVRIQKPNTSRAGSSMIVKKITMKTTVITRARG